MGITGETLESYIDNDHEKSSTLQQNYSSTDFKKLKRSKKCLQDFHCSPATTPTKLSFLSDSCS